MSRPNKKLNSSTDNLDEESDQDKIEELIKSEDTRRRQSTIL